MGQAAANGKNIWKAAGISLLSSAATYGIGSLFGGVGSLGKEALRAGAHGLSSGVTTALSGGNFLNGFASGALSSGIGSFAQGIKMPNGAMVGCTTAMGGLASWATGGDFWQGAMNGLVVGALNHSMHKGEKVRVLKDGTLEAIKPLPEVEIIGHYRLHEKGLEGIYPELVFFMAARAIATGVMNFSVKGGKAVWNKIINPTSNRIVQFGNNPNQYYHAFRHVEEIGLDKKLVKNVIMNDIESLKKSTFQPTTVKTSRNKWNQVRIPFLPKICKWERHL